MNVQDLIDALRKENANKSVSSFKRAFTNLNAADRQSLLNKFLSCLTQEDPVSSKKLLPVLGIIVDGIEGEALPVLKQTMIVTVMLKRVKFCLQLCFFTLNLKLADSMEEEIFSTIVQLIAKLDLGNYEMAESMLKGFFRSYPNIMQKFVNYLLQRPTIDQLDRFQFCLLMMKNESLGVFEGLVKRFLELLSKKLSSAVSVQSELTDLKWAHFFQCLPLEFWADESESSLQSNILKAIRKAPESLSCFVVHVLKYLNPILRVDSFLLNLLPSILRMLKSEDYEVKFNGIQSVKFGIHRCCDVQKISLFYKGFYDALNGKNPGVATISIPQDHHKFAILTSIDSIFAVISTLDSPSLKKETLDLFFNYVEKERDIEVFPLHGHVLLAAIGSQIDSETLHTLLNGLSKVRSTTNGISLRSFYLIALTSLFYLDDLIVEDEMCSKLLSALDSIVKESVKRENVLNYDALISFAIMCRLFDSFPQFRGEKERLAKLVSVYPNFVFNETVKLQLWKWLIAKNHGDICSYFRFSRLSSSSPVPQMILQRAVVHSIAMISYSLRDLILERSQQVSLFNNYFARFGHLTCSESSKFLPLTLILTSTYANSPSQPFLQRYSSNLLVQISAQLMELLGQIYDHNQELLKSSSSESVNPQPRRITVDGILTCLTASIVVANETELPFLLTLIPLILSSPCVTSSQRHAASRLRELFKRQEHIKLLYLSNLTEVALHLSNGSINSGVHHRQCALIAAFSLSCSLDQTSAKLFISHFSNNLHQILKNTYISKFTPEDAEIYRDFEEVVQKRLETVAQQGKGEVVSIQSDLRDHSRKRRDGASDNAIWAEKIRKEKASKDLPSNKSQSSTSTELEVLVRTEISLLRAKIEKSVEETSFVFSAINFLHCLDSGLVIEAFLVLLQGSLLFNIFRFPASQDFSWHLVAPLKKLFSSDIGDVTMDLVASLRIATSEFTEGVEPPLCFQNLLQRFETYRLETDDSNRHSLLLALLLPMLNQLCLFGDKTVGGKVFQILQNLLPNLSQLVQNYPAAFKLVRSKLSEIITATLMLTSRFPSNNFGVEEFMLENCLEALPLAPEELSLLCSASILFNERTEVQLFSVELLCGLASVGGEEILGSDSHVDALLWISQYTNSENVSSLLQDLWKEKTLSLEAFQIITNFLETSERGVRVAAGKSYGDALTRSAAVAEEQFILLSLKYDEMLPAKLVKQLDTAIVDSKQSSKLLMKSKPKLSQVDTDQKRYCRESIALAIRSICGSKVLSQSFVWTLLNFLIEKGVADSEADVRIIMTESAQVLMRSYGDRELGTLINFFEQVLERKPGKDEDITVYDSRHAASIILLGTLARHIQSLDNVLIKIVDMLIHSLQIPSESVQRSVSDCLLSICPNLKGTEYGTKVLETLLIRVLTGKTYGDRRGAAIALAALVKGYGLSALRQFNLISKLKDACSSGNLNSRQGALFAFEFLAERLTILFEPYVGGIVDILLACFSHSSDHVREAAAAATKVIMSKLTPHGIKQLLNPILSTLNTDTQWKSRQEAIKMLSIIVNCAPKQVAVSLPQIVSLLVRGTSDPHPKIKEAAKVALHGVSAVIRNPEIAGVGSTLLHALTDPANRTKDALEALLEIEFMHSIDPPSLALLMPILSRALKDRSADLKRKSAAITGNIIAMVNDSNALTGYVANLVVGLKDCLIDPTPDVRANGAKALGNLYNGLQNIEGSLKDILTWLFDTLQSEMSPVERSGKISPLSFRMLVIVSLLGAAQGLAEICGLCNDLAKRESLIERVLSLRNNFSPFAREGIMWFLSFLPSTLKEQAALYLDTSLPIILDGFHDEVDAVREVSIRAGKILITVLGLRHAVHIARILVTGLYKDDYKIRLYSSQLIGDLLLLLGDVKVGLNAFSEVDEGDDEGGEQLGATKILSRIRERLGKQLTDEVLASLYLVRSDFAVAVRQHALQIWKAIVANTPRTLIEIMPILIGIIVSHLSSVEEDLRLISGRCVGELVSKLGDRVLPEIIRPLEDGFQQSSEEARLGICTGLTEILTACSRKQAEDYIAVLIRTVHCALSDDAKEVSHQGAKAFMILYRLVGSVAVDQIVPVMIKDLASTTRDKAQKAKILRGLREIVCLKPREMLEYLLPLLLISPMTLPSAEALASILEVAGTYTYHHFHSIISLTIQELFSCESEQTDLAREKYQALRNLVITIVSSTDQTGLHQLVLELGRHVEHESNLKRRRWGCFFYELFFQSSSKAEYEEYLPLILKQLLSRITDSDLNVVMALKDCLTSMVSHIALEKFLPHVDFMRNCIASNISTARHKTGSQNIETSLQYFSLPKSLEPFLTLFLYGLVHGNTQAKEISAEIIGTLCSLALPEVLKPTLIKTVGPLIRILGERHPSTVKSAILTTIMLLLERGGPNLKPFAPQLQTTFIKCLSDPLREVRVKSAEALGLVISIHSLKVDLVLSELNSLIAQNDSTAIKISIFDAINKVLQRNGEKTSSQIMVKIKDSVVTNLFSEEESVRMSAARIFSNLVAFAEPLFVTDLTLDLLEIGKSASKELAPEKVMGSLLGLAYILQSAGIKGQEFREEVFSFISSLVDNKESIAMKTAISKVFEVLFSFPRFVGAGDRKPELRNAAQSAVHRFVPIVTTLMRVGESADIKINAIKAIKSAAKYVYGAVNQYFHLIFPVLAENLKDIDLRIRYAAERTFKYLCEGPSTGGSNLSSIGSNAFQQYLNRVDGELKRLLTDYQRRSVGLVSAESEEES